MIVGFREFEGRFSSRLEFCVGAVLVSPDGVQYECVKRSDYGAQWRIVGGQGEGGHVSIARMRELVGDGAGWMVAEVIPDAVFIVVDADNGSLGVGGGQGASRVRECSFLVSALRKPLKTWTGGVSLAPAVSSSIR